MGDTYKNRHPDYLTRDRRQPTQQVQDRPTNPRQAPRSSSPTEIALDADGLAAGTIKRVVLDKGFGFIRHASGNEYFFHSSVLGGGLAFDVLSEGDEVRFRPEDSPKGPRCGYVTDRGGE